MDKIEYIYLRHYWLFYMVAHNICEDREVALDVVQDGFLAILESKHTFGTTLDAKRYLMACIKNSAFARLKKEHRAKAMIHDFVNDGQTNSILDRLRGLVDKIKCPTSRAVIKDVYFNGKKVQDVAKEKGVSRQFIAQKHYKGLKQLAEMINK